MRIKLVEAVWNVKIADEAKRLRKAIDLYQLPGIKDAAIELYDKILEVCENADTEETIHELRQEWENFDLDLDNLPPAEDLEASEKLWSEIDVLLEKLYDFCDDNRIWLDVE